MTKESTTMNEHSSTSSFIQTGTTDSAVQEIFAFSDEVDLNLINQTEGLTPAKGNIDILLIPIHFPDISDTKFDFELLERAFNGSTTNPPEWYSVKEFYQKSSYGQCNLQFHLTEQFTASHPSSYYTSQYNNNNYLTAVESIIQEALTFLDETTDFSQFDQNDDGYIDGIYMIYDHPVDYTYTNSLWWAFTSYFQDNSIFFDHMKVKSYVFAGLDFLNQNEETCNTHTYIHEMAHMFGLDDYYDYYPSVGAKEGGLAGGDLMDGTIGDHNAFSKALLGWNHGVVVAPNQSITVSLEPFCKNGDYIILANEFDFEKGLLQEYFMLEYYTPDELNQYDQIFSIAGIRILHVVANTKKDGTLRFDNSTTTPKLLSQITTSDGKTYISSTTKRTDDTLFIEQEMLNSDDLCYRVEVNQLTEEKATLTIIRK